MSEAFVNQVTLDCLLNKEMFNKHIRSQKSKQLNKEDRKFYRKRIFNLFKEIISGNTPTDLLPDVKYAYDNFLNSAIHYFKTIDNNDIIQSEYNDIENLQHICGEFTQDLSLNMTTNNEADKLLMRTIKTDIPTLDKYVKKTFIKKKDEIILPKQKEINLKDPNLKNKGLKKNNINNLYEDNDTKNKNEGVVNTKKEIQK
jgi:hypothetical protein